jgi:DNA relaxase NicK
MEQEFKGFGKPPVSNTGVKQTETEPCVEVGIDWLAGTCHESRVGELQEFLAAFFSDEFSPGTCGVGFYQQSVRSVLGIVIGLYPYESSELRQDCYLSIPASVLDTISQESLLTLIKTLSSDFAFHYSRVDLKLDDYGKRITPSIAYETWKAGGISGFKTHHWHSSGRYGQRSGDTLNLGRRGKNGGGKFLRIYDKGVQSGGKIQATRVELELSGKRAREFAQVIVLACDDLETFREIIRCTICGAVDFVERDKSGRLDRSQRLSWWEAVIGDAARLRFSPVQVVQSIEKAKSWLAKQVAPTIATVLASFNGQTEEWWEFFWEMVLQGEDRMKQRHYALVNVSRMQKDILERTQKGGTML